MIYQGQTVFYRLSEENIFDINRTREFLVDAVVFDGMTKMHPFHGAPVVEGMMLPAEVVRCYSTREYTKLMFPHRETLGKYSKKEFSGYADLKVSLPGNDFLWVPLAQLDENPSTDGEAGEHGVGYLMLPEVGKFTVVPPAPLV